MHNNLEPNEIQAKPMVKNSKGGKKVPLVDKNDQKIVIQTPEMEVTFNTSSYLDNCGKPESYSVACTLDELQQHFLETLKALDKHLIDLAVENSVEWFGKEYSRDWVEGGYRRIVVHKNTDYPPFFKTKVCIGHNGTPNVQVYDENKNKVGIEYLTKGSRVKLICETSPVWFVNRTFGVTLTLLQAAVVSRPQRTLQDYAFVEDDK